MSKGICLKKKLSKEFLTVNVDECITSRKCYNCGSDIIKFMKRKNPHLYKKNEFLVNGLPDCKNGLCYKYYDRDLNGSLNIRNRTFNSIKFKNTSEISPTKYEKNVRLF
jgi:transposase